MWFGLLFLLIVGAGKMCSLDAAVTAAVTNSDAVRQFPSNFRLHKA